MSTSSISRPTPVQALPRTDKMLRIALRLDAIVTGVNGLMYLALAGPLHEMYGFPTAVQYPVGAFLLIYGVAVWAAAGRANISRGVVISIITLNVLWVLASLEVLLTDTLPATTTGMVWGIVQALTVGAFAAVQFVGLRRSSAAR